MNFLRQLFRIKRKLPTAEKLGRPNHESVIATGLSYGQIEAEDENFFEYVIGYYDVKRLLKMSIDADEPVHILLVGPPASAKTMFIKSLMKLNNSYFTDGGNSTKAGMLEYIFDNQPKYLLIDEIDKMSTKDQTFLLNLMETGIVTETKHRKTRTAINVKTWVFASSNDILNIISPLKSRFFVIELEPYSYEQFCQITVSLLTNQHRVKEQIAKATAYAVWNGMRSRNIRDCVRIGRMAKSTEDIKFIVDTLRRYDYLHSN
jgi:Holliday junction DNA helicase RuvB